MARIKPHALRISKPHSAIKSSFQNYCYMLDKEIEKRLDAMKKGLAKAERIMLQDKAI